MSSDERRYLQTYSWSWDSGSCTIDVFIGSFLPVMPFNMGFASILLSVYGVTSLVEAPPEVNPVESAFDPVHESWRGSLWDLVTTDLMGTEACRMIYQQIATTPDISEEMKEALRRLVLAELWNAVDHVVRHEHGFLYMMFKISIENFRPYEPPAPPLVHNGVAPVVDQAVAEEQPGPSSSSTATAGDQEEDAVGDEQYFFDASDGSDSDSDNDNEHDRSNDDQRPRDVEMQVEVQGEEETDPDEFEEYQILEAELEYDTDEEEEVEEEEEELRPQLSRASLDFYLAQTCFKGEEPETCTVCIESISRGTLVVQLPCCHFFHVGCITPWLERTPNCPNCRVDLPELDAIAGRRSEFASDGEEEPMIISDGSDDEDPTTAPNESR